MVGERGYQGLSFDRIAREVGKAEQTILHHFPSKGALGRQLLAVHFQLTSRLLEEVHGQAAVEKLIESHLVPDLEPGRRMPVTTAMAAEKAILPPGVQEFLATSYQARAERLEAKLYGEGCAVRARLIICLLEGARVTARALGTGEHFAAVAREVRLLATRTSGIRLAKSAGRTRYLGITDATKPDLNQLSRGDPLLILADWAGELFVQFGYRALTMRKLAQWVGIENPSIYHHFRSKEELVECFLLTHREAWLGGLALTNRKKAEVVGTVAELYSSGMEPRVPEAPRWPTLRMPFAVALAVEWPDLPEAMRVSTRSFFEDLTGLMCLREISLPGAARKQALTIQSVFNGASLMARALDREDVLDSAAAYVAKMVGVRAR